MLFHFNLIKDFRTVSEFRESISNTLDQLKNNQKPLIITQQGKPAAVVLDVSSYNQLIEDYDEITDILQGLRDSQEGRTYSTDSLREYFKTNGYMD